MNDADTRGLLRTIRVPFDIKAIFLGGIGFLVLRLGGLLLGKILDVAEGNVVSQFVQQGLAACKVSLAKLPVIGDEILGVTEVLYGPASRALDWWEMIIVGVWFLVVLSVFGGAICRIMALRIARDESLSVGQALRFSTGSLKDYLAVPVFLGLAIAFFWACNLLAGVVSSIPWLGQIVFFPVLFPLAILSSVIIMLIAVGGLLGLFLMVAAISTEKNGTLDAISRAFSYIFSRPLQFFFYYFLIFVLASIIIFVGLGIFPSIIVDSVDAGTWWDNASAGLWSGARDAAMIDFPSFTDGNGRGLSIDGAIEALFAWIFMILLFLGIYGYVVCYILGGSTSIYFALRRDVDGTEDAEIYLDTGDDEEDFGLPPVTPAVEKKPEEPEKEEPKDEEKKEEAEASDEEEKKEE